MKIDGVQSPVSFNRRLNNVELKKYNNAIEKSLKLLNKDVDIIIHNSSAPSNPAENIGIGSLFSNTVQKKLMPFLKKHGITGIQQEPNGLRKAYDISPYAPLSDSKNIYMIPLEKLASEEYHGILSKKTFENIVKNNPHTEEVDYDYVKKNFDIALKEAYENVKNKPEFYNELKQGFKSDIHEKTAVFEALTKEYKTDDWRKWKKIDRTLFVNPNDKKSAKRIAQLKEQYKDDIEFFNFKQMILEKESKKANEISQQTGVKIIGDSPVAQPTITEWVYQDLFLKDKAIGCPPDYFSKNGQRWGFKYFNPKEIFNEDGSLGRAGKVLKEKYENYFADCSGGMRIDHIIGLIDPFIYSTKHKRMTPKNSGRIYSVNGEFKKHSTEEYANILTDIVFAAAEKFGFSKDRIICEDLGTVTKPVKRVMEKLKLMGISVTQFDYRGKNAKPNSVIMLGSHDNKSFLEFTDDLFKNTKDKRFMKKTRYLAADTQAQGLSKKESKEYLNNIRTNKSDFVHASFVELFTSPAKKVQIFFTDFFGIPKTYNTPGTTKGNWSLRINENFEDKYYEAVSNGKAPNFAKILADTLKHLGIDKKESSLMKDLEESAAILSQKS